MAKMPGWIRVSKVQRTDAGLTCDIQVRRWHPAFWRHIARELKRHDSIDLSVSLGRWRFRVPTWLAAEISAAWFFARCTPSKGRH